MPRNTNGTVRRPAGRECRRAGDGVDAEAAGAHAFLVRLWKEARDGHDAASIWRGTLSTLRGRQLGSFTSAADLVGLVDRIPGGTVLVRFSRTEPSLDAQPTAQPPGDRLKGHAPCM